MNVPSLSLCLHLYLSLSNHLFVSLSFSLCLSLSHLISLTQGGISGTARLIVPRRGEGKGVALGGGGDGVHPSSASRHL